MYSCTLSFICPLGVKKSAAKLEPIVSSNAGQFSKYFLYCGTQQPTFCKTIIRGITTLCGEGQYVVKIFATHLTYCGCGLVLFYPTLSFDIRHDVIATLCLWNMHEIL